MIKVYVMPLQEDLSEFTQFLWDNDIPHRVLETDDSQELWISRSVNPDQMVALYELWKQGEDISQLHVVYHSVNDEGTDSNLRHYVLTSILIGVSVLLGVASGFGADFDVVRLFTIADVMERGDSYFTDGLAGTFESLELWRLITPIFLHFSLPHIIFNLLWVWVVGRRMEMQQGTFALLCLVIFSGLASNLAQFWVSGPLFGGMSGVVFALLGYAWLWDKTQKQKIFSLPPALMGFMLIWLVLGYTGILETLGFGSIANTAHLAGLIAGMCLVPVISFVQRQR